MKLFISAAAVLFALGGAASAQTLDDLKNDGKNTDNILTYGMGYSQHRYSPLKQIDKTNVKRLVPVWSLSLDNQWGEQAQPIVYNGVMYVTNAKATVAIDVATGKQIWKTPVEWLPETPRVVCCGVSNKGAAIYDGKVFRTTLDAFVVALDAKTGKEVWKQKAAEWRDGYSMTVAPLVANGVLITGISGAEFGIRGFIDGWDPETGKHLWRRYTIPARGEKGNETWPQDTNAWEIGGGSSLDHRLVRSRSRSHLLGHRQSGAVGLAEPAGRQSLHLLGAGDAAEDRRDRLALPVHAQRRLRLRRVLGADPRRHEGRGGNQRKVVMQLNRNGFVYVLDRTNGDLISAKPYEKVNWASHVDPETGRPVETDVAKKLRAGEQVEHWPSTRGAKNWPHAAFNPETGLLYANTIHEGRLYKHLPIEPLCEGRALPVHREPQPIRSRAIRSAMSTRSIR